MSEALRILLVEDSDRDAELLERELRRVTRTLELTRVDDGAGLRAALGGGRWDVVLSDWSLPRFGALAALEIVRDELRLEVPFIIVSGTISEEVAVAAMRAGAQDYVLKDKLARLAPAIERELAKSAERAAHRRETESFRQQEARLRAAIEKSRDGIALIDSRGETFYRSPSAAAILGVDPAQQEQQFALIHPDDRAQAAASMTALLRDGKDSALLEFRVPQPDGSMRWIEALGSNLLHDPLVQAVVVNFRDVTAQKRATDELRASEEQLRQAQKMEAIGRLAGGIAHDFNNLLSVILSYTEILLLELKPDDPIRDDLEEIRQAGARAADMTRQLLMFTRQQVIEPRVLDLNEILLEMHKLLQRLVGEDVELVTAQAQALGTIKMDRGQIEQVVMNLVINARDAMPTGGKLTIETADVVLDEAYASEHLEVVPGPHVLLAVSDTGVGMDRATQARIFEPFYTTKAHGKGTGLGLATVFGIVRQSGGSVWVYSEPGHGSTFKVYLPRSDGPADAPRPAVAPPDRRGWETILLVEDEGQVRGVALHILERQGYRVLAAATAAEALHLSRATPEPIHLLLTDVVMPQMSGPELAKLIGAERPGIKLLCMSGYTDDAVIRHGVLDATIAFVQKPITPEVLARRVREVLGSPEGAA